MLQYCYNPNIKIQLNEGSSLAKALGDYPKVFSGLFVNRVRAGERAGAVESISGWQDSVDAGGQRPLPLPVTQGDGNEEDRQT